MKILGISCFYHDSAACLIEDGEILSAAQEERFTRKKHDKNFPHNAVKFCLSSNHTGINEIDAIVFYEKPFLKFERLLETYYAFAPKGFRSFLEAIPVWIKEKLFLKEIIRRELAEFGDVSKLKILFPEHHLSHAASAFYPSPFKESAILTIDGVGEWATSTIGYGKDNKIKLIKELRYPHSVGLLYSAFTYFLGFKVNSGEYKLMGLSPYGNPYSDRVKKYIELIKQNIVDIKEDGSIFLNQSYFNYSTGLTMINDNEWEKLFGFKRRDPESELEQHHCDLAMAIQKVTEEIILKMASTAKKLTGSENLCLSGGVALNCVANSKILESGIFKNIWIQPAAGDAGGALGSALAVYYMYFDRERIAGENDSMKGSYLGPEFNKYEIENTLKKYKAVYEYIESDNELFERVAKLIADGKVIGWFQGKMEWGPRALGNRSIIADARNTEMQKKLNLKIKFRESFRPFAPSVLWEETNKFFEINTPSPYMLLITRVKNERLKEIPENYHELPVRDKLYILRSDIPAVTHIDFTARLQTVHMETNPRYYNLIKKFKELTGYGIIVNTSFNVRGEPIVLSPEDAYKCFMATEMDYLVLGNFILDKTQQKVSFDRKKYLESYELD